MKILTIVGARPQFIKAAPLSRAIRAAGHTEFLLHTGQHYDHGMSAVFFEELGMQAPDTNLNVRSGNHGQQTGEMLAKIEAVLLAEQPACVIVFGDTNSTLAGALAAVKLGIRLAHVEAGLRSFNRAMPEEHNRVLTDHSADLLFCPTQTAVDNLKREGLTQGVHLVGDPMYDAVLQFSERAKARSTILKDLDLHPKGYLLTTIHRAYNTDDPAALKALLTAFAAIPEPVVLPLHPRTRARLAAFGLAEITATAPLLKVIEPVGYLDMLMLEENARMILTDSGGVQKEAYFCGVPCVTLRPETEWVETVQAGWNVLAGTDPGQILAAVRGEFSVNRPRPAVFGDGRSAEKIVRVLASLTQ